MPQSRAESKTPWIVAAVAGVLAVALAVVFFAVLLPYRRDHRSPARTGLTAAALTSDEKAAVAAAGTEAANLVSYRRAHFTSDFQRAVTGAIGSVKADALAQKSSILATMTKGKFDLIGKLNHAALVGPTIKKTGYIVLVSLNGYTSATLDTPIPSNLAVTVQNIKGKWLVSGLQSIGVA